MQKSTDTKIARFIFERWDNSEMKEKYKGDPGCWEMEIRHELDCPDIFRWIPTMYFPANPNEKIDDFKGFEGRVLEVVYYKDSTTPEAIEKFFDEYKIRVHRAEPFLIDDENTYNATAEEAQQFINKTNDLVDQLKKYSDNPSTQKETLDVITKIENLADHFKENPNN